MKKLTLTILFVLFTVNVFAFNQPVVRYNKIIVSGVNIATTSPDGKHAIFSNMFARLHAGEHYKIVINAETDRGHACAITRVVGPGNETPIIGDFFHEPGVWFTPAYDAVYSVRCIVGKNDLDLIGIVVEEE